MANPQKEDGHIDIANEIVEALAKAYLSSYESQVLWAIFRKTYGWHKKMDWITGSQLVKMTTISKSHVSETLKRLIHRNLVIKNGNKLGFQKDFEKWEKFPKQGTPKKFPIQDKKFPKQGTEVPQTGNKKFPKQGTTKETKETLTKETIQKTLSHTFEKCDPVYQLTIYFEGKIRENNRSIQKRKEPQLQSWCKDMDKLIRLDKANPNEIKKIIDWVVQDNFWCKNVLCPASLRKYYPRFYKEIIDRGKSLEEKIATDHRLDDVD